MFLAKIKSDIQYSLEEIRSKLYSLRSVKFTYKDWYKILRVYYVGGSSVVTLKDTYGNEVPLIVNKNNVSQLVRLARALHTCRRYEVKNDDRTIVILDTCFDIESILKDPLRFFLINSARS